MRKYNIVQPLYLSFFSKDFYCDAAKNWKGTSFLYLLILVTILCIPITMTLHKEIITFFDKQAPALIKQVPEIVIANGHASINKKEPYIIRDPQDNKPVMIIDSTGKFVSLEKTEAKILLTRKEVIVRKSDTETRAYTLSNIEDLIIDQKFLQEWAQILKDWLAVMAFPFIVIGIYVYRILQVLVYALLGILFSKILRSEMEFESLMSISIFAVTPFAIVEFFADISGLTIPNSGLLSFITAMGFLFFGIKAVIDHKQIQDDASFTE